LHSKETANVEKQNSPCELSQPADASYFWNNLSAFVCFLTLADSVAKSLRSESASSSSSGTYSGSPYFVQELGNVTVNEGEPVRFDAHINASPHPKVCHAEGSNTTRNHSFSFTIQTGSGVTGRGAGAKPPSGKLNVKIGPLSAVICVDELPRLSRRHFLWRLIGVRAFPRCALHVPSNSFILLCAWQRFGGMQFR